MRRIFLIAFALMVLLPSLAFAGRSEYLCRFDGKVRSSCCCPPAGPKHEAPGPVSVRGACCCTIVETAPARVSDATETHASGTRSHQPALIASVSPHLAVLPIASAVVQLPRSLAPPPRSAQSLFVRHCAWLL